MPRVRKEDSPGTKSGPGGPFDGIVGQDRICRLLRSFLDHESVPSLLFVGPPGVGKRTVALEFARLANCTGSEPRPCGRCKPCRTIGILRNPDIKLVFPVRPLKRQGDGADATESVVAATLDRYAEFELGKPQPVHDSKHRIRIELVRWLRGEMSRPPHAARRRFFIILHAHRMTDESANALLRILEEPQEATSFILTTDNPSLLLETIRSRCRVLRFAGLSAKDTSDVLVRRFDLAPAQAELAAAIAHGSVSRALRFARRESDLLVPAVVDYFNSATRDDRAVLRAAESLKRVPQSAVTDTFLLLFRETLRVKLGLDSAYARHNPAVVDRAKRSSIDYLRRALSYILQRDEDSVLYTNEKLSACTLLSALRPPQR